MEPIQDADGMWLVVIQGSSITRKFGSKGEALAWIEDNTPKPTKPKPELPKLPEPELPEVEPPVHERERPTG